MKRMLDQEEIEKLIKLLNKVTFDNDGNIIFCVKVFDKDGKEIKGA